MTRTQVALTLLLIVSCSTFVYAFVTVEGVGSEPGTVEVIDLSSLKTVATLDVSPGAAGIDFYKATDSHK